MTRAASCNPATGRLPPRRSAIVSVWSGRVVHCRRCLRPRWRLWPSRRPSSRGVRNRATTLRCAERNALTSPTIRDRHLQSIAARGRLLWQKAAGYNWRAPVEADISRFKRVIGDGLRARTDQRRATEVEIAVNALNQMLELGRPQYVALS